MRSHVHTPSHTEKLLSNCVNLHWTSHCQCLVSFKSTHPCWEEAVTAWRAKRIDSLQALPSGEFLGVGVSKQCPEENYLSSRKRRIKLWSWMQRVRISRKSFKDSFSSFKIGFVSNSILVSTHLILVHYA